jgi:hypothetical protein
MHAIICSAGVVGVVTGAQPAGAVQSALTP